MNWLVSGCSSGLGLALVEALLTSGENVLLAARDRAPLASQSVAALCQPIVANLQDRGYLVEIWAAGMVHFGH